MRLEALVTCLDFEEWQNENEPNTLINLIGVFHHLSSPPDVFFVYFELRRNGGDGASVRIRCRQPGVEGDEGVWFESSDELILEPAALHRVPFRIAGVAPPKGRSVVELLLDGRVKGSRVVDLV